jgi:hypothetical protein
MMKRIKVKEAEPIDVAFTWRERTLIIDHTFADPQLTAPLENARERQGKVVAAFTLYDIEELCGYIAAEANHTNDARLARELRRLFARLSNVMKRYDDGNWQMNFR